MVRKRDRAAKAQRYKGFIERDFSMKIALDARMITFPMHGISRYAFNLIKGLLRLDTVNSYVLIVNNENIEGIFKKCDNVSFIKTDRKLYGVLEQAAIPRLLKKIGADIFHSPTYTAPILQPCKTIMTIHDMIPMLFTREYPLIHKYYFRHIVKQAAHKAVEIITVSESSKRDIIDMLHIPPEKITVTYNAAEHIYQKISDKSKIENALKKFGIYKKYILYIGNQKFHKNLNNLTTAFKKIKEGGDDHLLVISGYKDERLLKIAGSFGSQILFIGDVNDADLPSLYNGADLFAMPSLYEGFGLPALEAMACGTPVLTSNTSSMPEVVGDAGIMANPYNSSDIASKLKLLLTNEALRKELSIKGIEKAKIFSWDYTARLTLDIYQKAFSKLKIGFNAQKYTSLNTGVGVYTRNIIKGVINSDKDNLYYIYSNKNIKKDVESFNRKNVFIRESNHTTLNFIRILWEQCILPIKQYKDRLDIFHYPDHTLSIPLKISPTIITVHDLAFIRFPQLFNRSRWIYKNIAVRHSFKSADFIIANSHSTKNDILEFFPFVDGKIEVIYLGVDKDFKPIESGLSEMKKKLNLPQRFILFIGTLEPRKNIKRLMQSYKLLKDRYDIPHKLVICGTKGWLYDDIFKEKGRLGLNNGDILFTGFIEKDILPYLYSSAELFVYPSLYEGFGLPVLEAMACGVPVVTSNISAIPEVAGDAAILTDPYDIEDIAGGIYTLIKNDGLRQELKIKGIERARLFTWERSAAKTVEVYKKVLEGRK